MKKYKSNYRTENSLLITLKDSFKQVVEYKWLIFLSIKKQNKLSYQQDVFGLFWIVLMPIIPMTAYILLATIKVFNTVEEMPFVFYIVVGMFVWMLMSSIIIKVMLSIKKERAILQTTNVSILVTMLSQLGEILFDSLIRFIAVIFIIIWFKLNISIFLLALTFICLVPVIIISFSIGVICAILDVIIQDTRKFVDIFFRYGLFVSSVIFPFPTDGILGAINGFNIFNTYVNSIRDLLYYGQMTNLPIFIYSSVIGIILFVIAIRLVYIFDYKIREYL